GEFHAGAALVQTVVVVLGEAAHAAVHIVDVRPEHVANEKRKERIAKPPMEQRHRAWHHPAASGRKPATLNQVEAFPKLVHELGDLPKIVAIVGVPHDDELPPRSRYASHERIAVTLLRHGNDAGPQPGGNGLRAVGTAIVGHD